jgi:hypothetical protein
MGLFAKFGRSDDERRQEALNAYLDRSLPAAERQRLEEQLAADPDLRSELEQLRLVQQRLGALPRLQAPRNFTLDPAVYGRRPSPWPAPRLYQAMRAATVAVALFLVMLVGADVLGLAGRPAAAPSTATSAQEVALATVTVEAEAARAMAAEEAADRATSQELLMEAPAVLTPAPQSTPAPGEAVAGAAVAPETSDAPSPLTQNAAGELSATGPTASAPQVVAPSPTGDAAVEPDADEGATVPGPSSLRSLEAVLAGVLVLLAAATLWVRRGLRP